MAITELHFSGIHSPSRIRGPGSKAAQIAGILALSMTLLACNSDNSGTAVIPTVPIANTPTASEPAPTPEPTPEPSPAPSPEPSPEPTPAPAPEPTPAPEPAPEPTPEPPLPSPQDPTVPVVPTENNPPVENPPVVAPEPAPEPASVTQGCLLATAPDNMRFCYRAPTRTLSAILPDGSTWWSFPLPGEDATNAVRNLIVIGQQLFIVAELDTGAVPRRFELSSFDFNGAFITTTPLESLGFGNEILGEPGQPMSVLVHEFALIFATQFANGASVLIARVDVSSGAVIVKRRFHNQVLSTDPVIENGQLTLAFEAGTVNVDPVTLKAATQAAESSYYSLERRQIIRDKALSMLAEPPVMALEQLQARLNETSGVSRSTDTQVYRSCQDHGHYSSNPVERYLEEGFYTDYVTCMQGDLTLAGRFEWTTQHKHSQLASVNGSAEVQYFTDVTAGDQLSGDAWSVNLVQAKGTVKYQGDDNPASVQKPYASTSIRYFFHESPESTLTIEASEYWSNVDMHSDAFTASWKGSYSSTDNTTGVTETVTVDLSHQQIGNEEFVITGSIKAVAVGATTETFTISAANQGGNALRYVHTRENLRFELIEPW